MNDAELNKALDPKRMTAAAGGHDRQRRRVIRR